MTETKIKKGEILLITKQKSDDYRPIGVFEALSNFDVCELRAEFLASFTQEEQEWMYLPAEEFVSFLLKRPDTLKEVSCKELWLPTFDSDFPEEHRLEPWKVDL